MFVTVHSFPSLNGEFDSRRALGFNPLSDCCLPALADLIPKNDRFVVPVVYPICTCFLPAAGQLLIAGAKRRLVSLPLANQTRNHILYTLSIVLREAKRAGLVDANPAEDIGPMGKDFRSTLALADEELITLFPESRTAFGEVWPGLQYGVMYSLMVSSGTRPGEARALEWSSVILDVPAVLIG